MDPIRDPEENEINHLSQLGHLENARIMEIGCGDGRMTWRYAHRPASVAGLDPGLASLATAIADRPPDLSQRVGFIQGNAEALPFANESFDTAILSWSL